MSVPNTTTFSLNDVRSELGLSYPSSQSACFAASVDEYFDAVYKGNKDRLSNFRNYGNLMIITYGYLYNHYAAADARNICSEGWHIPSDEEFDTMGAYLGGYGNNIIGGKLKETGLTYWYTPNTGATNEVGFNARGAGIRYGNTGVFMGLTNWCYWINSNGWTTQCQFKSVTYNSADGYEGWQNEWHSKASGNSIRLVKDSTTLTHGQTGTYTGNDGKVYRTICIDTQEWLADNLAETKYRNGDSIPEVTDNAAWVVLTTGARCAYNNDENNV
jgi:uncharacterized protein (TIGR02145 family)